MKETLLFAAILPVCTTFTESVKLNVVLVTEGSTESVRRPSETKTELLLLDTKGAFVVGMPVSIRTPSTSSRGKLSTLGAVPVPFASPATKLTRYAPLGTAISHTRGGYCF